MEVRQATICMLVAVTIAEAAGTGAVAGAALAGASAGLSVALGALLGVAVAIGKSNCGGCFPGSFFCHSLCVDIFLSTSLNELACSLAQHKILCSD